MDQETLVGPDVTAAKELLTVLDEAGFKSIVAFFMFAPEYGEWRFVLSTPSLDQSRSLKASETLHNILRGRFVYNLPAIMVVPTSDPFIRTLRSQFVGKVKVGGVIRIGALQVKNRPAREVVVVRLPGVTAF